MVSVIIPNYNHAPYLQQRIESVLSQSYQDFEIIILDDCSLDGSREVIERYRGHSKIRAIEYNSHNGGSPFRQWQKGIDLARGEYIWIAESDDFASTDFLQMLMPYLVTEGDLVYCRSYVIDQNGDIVNGYYWPDQFDVKRWKSDYVNEGSREISDYLVYGNIIPNASACVFKKEKFKVRPEILTMKYCGDWLFWIDYLKASRVCFVSKPLNFHRKHTESTRGLKDFTSEILRLKEYWSVIRQGRAFSGKGVVKWSELWRYNWIFEEMFQKRGTIGWKGIFRTLPISLYLPYFFFFMRKRSYKLISGR